ncbi:MAG: hypothetical protein ACYDCL_14755 [Myxococcales bacterium]
MPRPLFTLAALAALAGCQSYRFENVPTQPVTFVNDQVQLHGAQKAPSIMIVQDTSGSMCESIQLADSAGNACVSTAGNADAKYCSFCQPGDTSSVGSSADCGGGGACATKMQLTSSAMNQILGELNPTKGSLFLGLTAFPSDSSCGTPTAAVVPIGDATQTIPQIEAFYSSIADNPNGGTPTAATLGVVAQDPAMTDPTARKFVLLVTDGLPNCNGGNACGTAAWSNGQSYGCESPNFLAGPGGGPNASPPAGCTCSFGSCNDLTVTASCCTGPSPLFCLDGTAAVGAVQALYNQGVTTYVVGMGLDYSAGAAAVLDEMAQAGQNSPDAGHIQANDPATLLSVLQNLIRTLSANTCSYFLDQPPVDPGLITVAFNGQVVPNDPNQGWTFVSPNEIDLHGSLCTEITDGGTGGELEITAVAK